MSTIKDIQDVVVKAFGKGVFSRDGINYAVRCPVCKDAREVKKKMVIRLDDGRYHCWVCGAKGTNVKKLISKIRPDVLDGVTKDSYKINPVSTKEVYISIYRILAEFSERCAIEYYWSLRQNLIDNRIRRAVFFSCKREGFLIEALRLSDSIDSEEDRSYENWKILEQIEAIILEGDEPQITKAVCNRNCLEEVGNEDLLDALIWIGKDSSLIRQFFRNPKTRLFTNCHQL